MANYDTMSRTNYFRVRDEEAFLAFMKNVTGEERVEVWPEQDEDGNKVFGFGCGLNLHGWDNSEDGDAGCDEAITALVEGLKQHVAPGDAVILRTNGNEKLRYLAADACIITSDKAVWLDLDGIAISKAREMLNNPEWQTDNSY